MIQLRQVKTQLDFVLGVATTQAVTSRTEALSGTVDEWIAKILQKELKTFQNAYQHEARLLMKFKDLLVLQQNLWVTLGSGRSPRV
ncbi:MAG: hypothetical protein IIC36_13120 [Gemmatimonadetes bacterium]|nr:hypothetical protein [Gemmatimonadota bacterium]